MNLLKLIGAVLVSYAFSVGLAAAENAVDETPVKEHTIGVDTLIGEAEQGDRVAQAELGERYATGRDVLQDFERAAHWRKVAAGEGDVRAQNALGKQFAAGLGVPQDKDTALKWLQRAAEGNNPEFWFDLAVFYEQTGDDSALQHAVALHRKGVEEGHIGAHAHLGLMYYKGTGVAKDLGRAAELLGHAAEHGHARAQNNLGLMLSQGEGVQQDYQMAVALFQSAVEQGLKEAYTNLGVMYENGFGVEFDEARAVELYRAARLHGSLDGALEQVGFLQDSRIAIDIVTHEDFDRLLDSAARGDSIAQFQCGYLLLGTGSMRVDYPAAAALFEKAAANGISTAMTNLGLLYFRGLGVPQDYVLGLMWVNLGAGSGRKPLVDVRDFLAAFLSASQINAAQTMVREHLSAGRAQNR